MTDADILAMVGRLARIVANDGHAAGLKPAQWEALRYLARANRFSRTPGALTRYLGATKGTVSQTLMTLQRSGLVKKQTGIEDRRSVRLSLTPAGRTLLARDEARLMADALAMLPAEGKAALQYGLSALLEKRLEAGGGRPFGQCRDCRYFDRAVDGPGRHFCLLLKQRLSDDDAKKICVEQEAA